MAAHYLLNKAPNQLSEKSDEFRATFAAPSLLTVTAASFIP